MGHYTIRTNDDEDQAIKKAQEATGQASASKTFMTAILELQRNRDEMAQLSRKIGIPVSISVGIAVFDRDGNTFETLYKLADKALYQVKRSGKNAIAFASAPVQTQETATRDSIEDCEADSAGTTQNGMEQE